MIVVINAHPTELPDGATVADAVARATADLPASAPFAVAVNLQFVPRAQYPHTPTDIADAPSTVTKNTGSRLWIISDERSMNRLTKPRAITPWGNLIDTPDGC